MGSWDRGNRGSRGSECSAGRAPKEVESKARLHVGRGGVLSQVFVRTVFACDPTVEPLAANSRLAADVIDRLDPAESAPQRAEKWTGLVGTPKKLRFTQVHVIAGQHPILATPHLRVRSQLACGYDVADPQIGREDSHDAKNKLG